MSDEKALTVVSEDAAGEEAYLALDERRRRYVDLVARGTPRRRAVRGAGFSGRPSPGSIEKARGMHEALAWRQRRLLAVLQVDDETLLAELSHMALGRLTDVAEWDGEGNVKLRASEELSELGGAAIAEISQGKGNLRVKVHGREKFQAIETLLRIRGVLTEHRHVTHQGEILILVPDNQRGAAPASAEVLEVPAPEEGS